MDFSVILFHAHSGLRYLVILAGLLSLSYSLYALASSRSWDRPGRIFLSAFVGLMDLQILMGIGLTFYLFRPAVWGHLTTMILAAVVGHVAAARIKRRPPEPQRHRTAALGSAGALILIVIGILAIGRPIL